MTQSTRRPRDVRSTSSSGCSWRLPTQIICFLLTIMASSGLREVSRTSALTDAPVERQRTTSTSAVSQGGHGDGWIASSGQVATGQQPVQLDAASQQILDDHNILRAEHHVGPLQWDADLAAGAAQYAAMCLFSHDPNNTDGENIMATSIIDSDVLTYYAAAVDMWYAEVDLYDWSHPGFSQQTGHFTQIVWKDTTQLGCALQICSNGIQQLGMSSGAIVICRYSPPGNWWGEFEQNVFPINYVSPQPPNSTTPSTPPQQDPASPKPQPKPSPPSPWQSPGPHHPGPRSSPTPPVPNPGGNGTTNPGPTAPATSPSPEPKLPVTPGVLVPGKSLVSNSCMYSKRRLVKLCVQNNGNLVLRRVRGNTRLWSSGTANRSKVKPLRLTLSAGGNLTLSDSLGNVIWSPGIVTTGAGPFSLGLQDSGALALYDGSVLVWTTKPQSKRGR